MKRQASTSSLPGRRDVLCLGAVLLLTGCGTPPRRTTSLSIGTKGDLLEYSTQTLECGSGDRVQLAFSNAAKYVSFEHNWVLVRAGTFDAVVAAATAAGEEHGWLPQENPAVLAATRMARRGETVTVVFDAPPPGRYPYLCTMPGHAASMWGVFTVRRV